MVENGHPTALVTQDIYSARRNANWLFETVLLLGNLKMSLNRLFTTTIFLLRNLKKEFK